VSDRDDEVLRLVQRGFDQFTSGDESFLTFIHPDCRWEENQLMGFPGLDDVYLGPDGVRRWMSDTRDVWAKLRCIVEEVSPLDGSVVVAARLSAVGEHDAHADMRLYNVFWERDGMTIRRQIYFDRDEAFKAAARRERSTSGGTP
jgi:hypothetical protein